MISHKNKAIFIHLPKCAGSSIEHAFGHSTDYNGRSSQDHRSIRDIQPIKLIDISHIKMENIYALRHRINYYKTKKKNVNPNNYNLVSNKEYQEYFKFTFVRNPYHRAYSWYNGIMKDPINRRYYGLTEIISFEDFLINFMKGRRLMKPYIHFLKDFSGNVPMDYIGKFENLNEDFNTVCKKTNLNIELPHKNNKNSTVADYSKIYTEKSYDLVTDFYSEDLTFFNYSFD